MRLLLEPAVKDVVEKFQRNQETFDTQKVFNTVKAKYDGVTMWEHWTPVKNILEKMGIRTQTVAVPPVVKTVTLPTTKVETLTLKVSKATNRLFIPRTILQQMNATPGTKLYLSSYGTGSNRTFSLAKNTWSYGAKEPTYVVGKDGTVKINAKYLTRHQNFKVTSGTYAVTIAGQTSKKK